ncbi:MAG: hypothetical protein ACRELC_03970 [Gemmatimonadota bacterium]
MSARRGHAIDRRLCATFVIAAFGCGPGEVGEAGARAREELRDLPPGVLVDAREWHVTDTGVDTRGLDIRFGDEDDDVEIWSGGGDVPSGLAGRQPFVLADTMRTFRVGNERWGVGFEVRARGTGSTVGSTIELGVMRALGESPTRYGGQLESGDASVGDWIEVEHARLVRLDGVAGDTTAGSAGNP